MKDLTKGHPIKVIIMFAIPLMIGNILQQLYAMTDSKIVSMYVGTDALAAVGGTAIVSNTLVGFVNGLTQGFAIMIARCFGAKDNKSLRKYLAGTIILTFSFAAVLMTAGSLLIRNILELMRFPEDIIDPSVSYVRIIILGMLFVSGYNMCSNTLRAVGDSKRPLICLIISVVLNICFDLIFIRVFKMGVEGAAYATILAQLISFLSSGYFLVFKYRDILPKKDEWGFDEHFYKNLLGSGISMGLMGCIVNIGTVFLQSAIDGLGTVIIAAHTAGRRVIDLLMVVIYTIGFSMTTYVSQNIGAGEKGRVRSGIKYALLIDTVLSTVIIIFTFICGENIVRWIASTDNQEIIQNGVMYLKIGVLFYYVLGPLFILRCSLQGMGYRIITLFSSGLELLIKLLFAFIFVPMLGYVGVAFTEPVSWVIMTIPLIVVYLIKQKELR